MIQFCFLALLLGLAAGKDSYVVIVPKDVRPGVPLNISVNILHATGDVTVTAKLQNKQSNNAIVSSAHGTFQQNVPGNMMVPVPDSLTSGNYKLTVEGAQGLTFENSTDLRYERKSLSIFVQTDKAMYKPGQTVHYRAFAVYPNLTVYLGSLDIDIYDPNSNKIKQIKGVKDASGVYTNFMIMDSKPVLGDWKITVHAHGQSKDKVITIAEYVLPKFEVTVELPPFSLTSDDNIKGTVKAKYTYGKPVKGKVTLRAKLDRWYRPYNYHGAEPMVEQTMDINGEAKFTIPLASIKAHQSYMANHKIAVEANVTETLTKATLKGSSKVQFYSHAEKIEFLPSNPTTFKPGLTYTAYIRIARQDDSPVMGAKSPMRLTTTVTYDLPDPKPTPLYYYGPRTSTYSIPDHSFTVPDTGVVAAQITIPSNATRLSLQAHYGSITAYKSLSKMYSPSNSYIQLELQSTSLMAGQTAGFHVKSTSPIGKLVYQVLGRGSIVRSGTADGGNKKQFSFQVPLDAKMAPNARIVTYFVRSDGEIVTDSISFNVDGTFSNQVSISFDKSKAQPGEAINVDVHADPTSIVNLLAVDQSVLLLKSGNDITPEEVADELKTYDTISPSNSPFEPIMFGGIVNRRKRMIFWPYPTFYGGSDAKQVFNNAGVKVITDATVYHHIERHYYPTFEQGPHFLFGGGGGFHGFQNVAASVNGLGAAGHIAALQPNMPQPKPQQPSTDPILPMAHPDFDMAGAFPTAAALMPQPGGAMPPVSNSNSLKEVEKIRTDFPETWLWLNKTAG